MNKKEIHLKLSKERWHNNLNRKGKKINSPFNFTQEKIYRSALKNDASIIKNFPSKLHTFLSEFGFIEYFDEVKETVDIPKIFSIEENNKKFRTTLGEIIYCISNNNKSEFTLDFSKCLKTDEPTIFFLNIILIEFKQYYRELNARLTIKDKNLELKLIHSNEQKVNHILFLYKNIKDFDLKKFDFEKDDFPFKHLGYLKGEKSKKHYLENKKDIYTTQIVRYLNSCMEVSKYCFSENGINELEGIISEILNNAEDHSPMNTYYVTSTFSLNNISEKTEDLIGVLNINFLNFGYSFYDGLLTNRNKNYEIYDIVEKQSLKHNFKNFTKENVYTLLALQEGISRLKYEDESRGTGTMKFIGSFMNIGDYEDSSKNLHPHLKIFTGSTLLICDKKYKPYFRDGSLLLSLNSDNDLDKEPDKRNLLTLQTKFPGTMISVKIYLNEKNLATKVKDNGN